jgi:hypothetical protein
MSHGFTNKQLAYAGSGVTDIFINGVKQASTSGSSISFTIPSGVKKVTMVLQEASASALAQWKWRLGDSSGVATTGYNASGHFIQGASTGSGSSLTEFGYGNTQGANHEIDGTVEFTLLDAATNLWVCTGQVGTRNSTITQWLYSGSKSLSSELTTIELSLSTGTFDNGSINVQYDNPDPTVRSSTFTGAVVQTVHTQDGEVATGTTLVGTDDTIPQNTEGDEYMTASITPTNAANKLKIEVSVFGSYSVAAWSVVALFQDSTADALAVQSAYQNAATGGVSIKFTHWMTAGTTSSTTFKVRAGSAVAGTFTFNGSNAGRFFGGRASSSITITEYQA